MFQLKQVFRFLLFFILAYVGLMFLAFGLKEPYAKSYRVLGKAIFENYGEKGFLQFMPYETDSSYKLDTKVVLFNRDQVIAARKTGQATVKGADLLVSSWYNGLLPTIILLSLILASPVPWKRKLIAGLFGLILIYLFILLKLHLSILHEFEQNEWLAIRPPRPRLVRTSYEIFVANIETTIIIPVFIWVAVTFRKKDWRRVN